MLKYEEGDGLALASVSHTFNKGTPLYEIKLGYRSFASTDSIWGQVSDDGFTLRRRRVLDKVDIVARNNLDPTLQPKVIRLPTR